MNHQRRTGAGDVNQQNQDATLQNSNAQGANSSNTATPAEPSVDAAANHSSGAVGQQISTAPPTGPTDLGRSSLVTSLYGHRWLRSSEADE
ncbi:hypothetical protein RSOLAG22IIIB_12419 [Rhizoctonia solani]|uniref:Uncharacterized protein n=1 Tax=Rhizoctonia solani TaxID=456999 RepID=A0A0K6GE38_9AGAM|nr:hypothetical protein RSOLAG22IIIB_12419 [Rhizoctonia solani]